MHMFQPIRFYRCAAVTAIICTFVAAGCGGGNDTQVLGVQAYSQRQKLAPPQQYGGGYRRGTATGDTQEGADCARWVMDQDPGNQYVTDAVVRGDQSLGVKVQPTVSRGQVQQLLISLTERMARTFPGRPLEVVALYQNGAKLGESLYDPRTGQPSVQFTQ